VAVETAPESPPRRPEPTIHRGAGALATVDSAALRLLACAALATFLVCLLILPGGPSESTETPSWVLAFAVALPAGLLLAGQQARRLAAVAPAAAAPTVAAGTVLLAAGFLLRHGGSGDRFHHLLVSLASLAALAAPFLAARLGRSPGARGVTAARAISLAATFAVLLFVPSPALRLGALLPALALAAAALLALRLARGHQPRPWVRNTLDVVLCGLVVLVVVQLPNILEHIPDLAENHTYFLGPANDALHGRPMLAGAWSQYGVGLIDALALTFTVIPIGFGSLSLIIIALTVGVYLCVYASLRLAGVGQVLTMLTLAVAAAGNLFAPLDVYISWPNDSPLRFGMPYLIVLLAIAAGRYPARARALRIATLAVLAVSAAWSFEVFVYCGGTYGALVLVEALAAGTEIARRVARGALLGLAASAAGVALLSLLTFTVGGSLEWGPYFEYLKLYSFEGFSQLPVVFFSAGPLMGVAVFASAVLLLWLARERPAALAPPLRAALAGFTGLATVTFTYYLGRSHPNNLLILLVPVVALGGLWVHLLLAAVSPARWRTLAAATVVLAGAMLTVSAWSSIQRKWDETALGLMVPGQGSLTGSLDRIADNPPLDGRESTAAALLARYLPPRAPALVLTEPELTTEILVRAGRPNLLPISNPAEDSLIESSRERVLDAVAKVPAGTLMLTQPVVAGHEAETFNELQLAAARALNRRFAFKLVKLTPDGIALARLVPRQR
jgi:hypothetical protein